MPRGGLPALIASRHDAYPGRPRARQLSCIGQKLLDEYARAAQNLQRQVLLKRAGIAVLQVSPASAQDQEPVAIEHQVRARRRREQELDPRRGAGCRAVIGIENDSRVRFGVGGYPGRRQAEVACAARVRLDRQPDLKPAERRVSIGNLDRDRQPPLDQGPELAGQLAQKRRRSAQHHQRQAPGEERVLIQGLKQVVHRFR